MVKLILIYDCIAISTEKDVKDNLTYMVYTQIKSS